MHFRRAVCSKILLTMFSVAQPFTLSSSVFASSEDVWSLSSTDGMSYDGSSKLPNPSRLSDDVLTDIVTPEDGIASGAGDTAGCGVGSGFASAALPITSGRVAGAGSDG